MLVGYCKVSSLKKIPHRNEVPLLYQYTIINPLQNICLFQLFEKKQCLTKKQRKKNVNDAILWVVSNIPFFFPAFIEMTTTIFDQARNLIDVSLTD